MAISALSLFLSWIAKRAFSMERLRRYEMIAKIKPTKDAIEQIPNHRPQVRPVFDRYVPYREAYLKESEVKAEAEPCRQGVLEGFVLVFVSLFVGHLKDFDFFPLGIVPLVCIYELLRVSLDCLQCYYS